MSVARLRPISRWQAQVMREDLADLYVESTGSGGGHSDRRYSRRDDFLARLAGDARQPGFGILVAETTKLAGCAFGFAVGRDCSWWRGFQGPLPAFVKRLTASGRVFAVTAIVVHPREPERGLPGRLQKRLFSNGHASLGVTLLDRADSVAYGGFTSWGWRQIGEIHRPLAPGVLRTLVLPLGERITAAVDGLARKAPPHPPQ
jgi:hypothetical protein